MKDFIPKGTGNGRYLKSVSDFMTRYPTYADFCSALVAGTLPIDLNGVNSGGYTQLGTALNKANLLSDTTARKYFETTPTLKDVDDGEIITIDEYGSPVDYYVVKHDYQSDLNGTGRVLVLRKDNVKTGVRASTSSNAYFSGSTLDVYMNGEFMQRLSSDIYELAGFTKIKALNNSTADTIETLSRRAFPLSAREYGFTTGSGSSGTVSSLDGENGIASSYTIALYNGTAQTHWTRSRTYSVVNVIASNSSGKITETDPTNTYGYRPAFTLPETAYVYEGKVYSYDPNPIDVSNVVPDEIFSILSGALLYDGEKTTDVLGNLAGVQIETDWYVGTGTYGSSNPTVISFGFTPRVVICYKIVSWSKTITNIIGGEAPPNYWGCNPSRMPDNKYIADIGIGSRGNSSVYAKYVFATNKMYLYNEADARSQLNASGKIYYWLAIK